jgi:uncharacterized protein YmfQ (DUF2313 family)
MAPTLERVDAAAIALIADTFPASTTNFIDEWDAALGLPDPCLGENPTLEQKRAQIVARLIAPGGQSAQFYIDYAAALGFEIAITAFAPFRAGRSRAGDTLGGDAAPFTWLVTILSDASSAKNAAFRAGQGHAGDPLSSAAASHSTLLCELNRIAPAHTVLLFTY